MKIKGIEITLREFLMSIIILFMFISFGIYINEKIYDNFIENSTTYKKSAKITDKETLYYLVDTKIGNSLIQGNFKSIGSVRFNEINGEYSYIRKVKEKYTQHTRTVCSGSGKNRTCHTEIYYTWDYYGDEEKYCKNIEFYGNKLETKKVINQTNKKEINLQKNFNKNNKYKLKGNYLYENSRTRYYYEYIPKEFSGTIFTNFKDEEKSFKNFKLFYNENIEKILENEENSINICGILFTIFWSIICLFTIYIFVEKENKWL